MVSFQDFQNLDKIVSVEKLENADRLLRLVVDFGYEQRQIISGLAEYYKPEELIGLFVPVLVNLEPKMFLGHKSQGMILMADGQDRPIQLIPQSEVQVGTVVR